MKPLRVALPKGRLQEPSLALFAAAGFDVPTTTDLGTRRLLFSRGGVEWILVKDSDVPVYVEHGAADAGIGGLDQILEQQCSAHQPLEFDFGRCRLMVIGARGAERLSSVAVSRIATKYPRLTRNYIDSRAIRAEVVPLAGSVELAAVLNLTTHVVDVVDSGETVRIHQLEIQELVAEIAPRLLISRSAYRLDSSRVRELITRMEEAKDADLRREYA